MKIEYLDRIDLYFSYWIFFWIILSIIFNDIQYPIILIIIALIVQYCYLVKYSSEIFKAEYYVIFGNITFIIIKYLLFIYGLIFKLKNYNIYKDLIISIILFLIFNIYYFIIVKEIYYILNVNKFDIPIDSGFPCKFFKKIFKLLG